MKKKVILIVVLAVVVALGAVFAVLNIHAPGELSTWQKMEIEYNFQKQFKGEWGPWEDDPDELSHSAHARYYGSENGYLILCKLSNESFGADFQQVIGKYKFIHTGGTIFQLFAYKDGEFLQLNDAYEQGLISDEAIKTAWEIHSEYPSCKSTKK